jgi:hypothetical protein
MFSLVLGAGACGGASGGDDVTLERSETTTTTTTAVAQQRTAPPTSTPPGGTGAAADEADREPADAVRAWAAAVAGHDAESAWALMHEASRSHFAGLEGFADADAGSAEGYGMWATAPDAEYTAVPLPQVGEAVTIVVVDGTVPMEGAQERMVGAVPVRTDADGNHQVDPFQDLVGEAGIEHQPAPGTVITPDHTFEVYLAGGRNVTLILDDAVLTTSAESSDGDRQHVTGSPAEHLTTGEHTLTVVVERDGAVQARSMLYTVQS